MLPLIDVVYVQWRYEKGGVDGQLEGGVNEGGGGGWGWENGG